MPSNVLHLHLKQTFPPIIWIFTGGEGDGIKFRLPFWKGCLSNLLERWGCAIFLFFELDPSNFGYFLFLLFFNCLKVSERLDTIYVRDFTRVLPMNFSWITKTKNIKWGDPFKMSNINVVQCFWNFAQLKKSLKKATNQNLKCLTQKTKKWGNNDLSRRFFYFTSKPSLFPLHDHTYNQFIEA